MILLESQTNLIHFPVKSVNEWHRISPSSGSLIFSHYTKSSFFLHKISEQELQTLISKLGEKKAIRHGGIPTKFLKLSNSVVTPFLLIFSTDA